MAAVEESVLDFHDFFETFARHVAAIVAVSTGDAALAEDATQEAMARAYVRWNRVSRLERPDLWVIRVAANIAIGASMKSVCPIPPPASSHATRYECSGSGGRWSNSNRRTGCCSS